MLEPLYVKLGILAVVALCLWILAWRGLKKVGEKPATDEDIIDRQW